MPYNGTPTPPVETLSAHHVRKDNVINFRGNYYAVPTGTYKGHDTIVYLQLKDEVLTIFSAETGKTLATHHLCRGRGTLVTYTSLRRDKEASLNDLEARVRRQLPTDDTVDHYLLRLREAKPRNLRDNLLIIERDAALYSVSTMTEAVHRCHESSVYNGHDLMCVAEAIRISNKEPLLQKTSLSEAMPKADTSNMNPEKTDISTYNKLFS